MKKILMPLPRKDFEPMEAAVPFTVLKQAGFSITIATPDGSTPQCDQHMLTGEIFGEAKEAFIASKAGAEAYREFQESEEVLHPIRWDEIQDKSYDALVLAGGHARGMLEYLESELLQELVVKFQQSNKLIAPICHGVLLACRAQGENGKSILFGKKVTAFPKAIEMFAWDMTKESLGNYFRTYPETTVQDEVEACLEAPEDFSVGTLPSEFDGPKEPGDAHVVKDGNIITARYPRDTYTFAQAIVDYLS